MTAACRVVRLALRGPSAPAVAGLADRLETALRLAPAPWSAPGELVLFRRLSLGPLPPAVSAHALADRLPAAFAAHPPLRLRPGDPEAPEAPALRFAGPVEALAALTIRLARGLPARAWYWPLVLPAWRPGSRLEDIAGPVLAASMAPPHGAAGAAGLAAMLLGAAVLDAFVAALRPDDARRALAGESRRATAMAHTGAAPGVARPPAPAVMVAVAEEAWWQALPAIWRAALLRSARRLSADDPRLVWLAGMAATASFGPAAATPLAPPALLRATLRRHHAAPAPASAAAAADTTAAAAMEAPPPRPAPMADGDTPALMATPAIRDASRPAQSDARITAEAATAAGQDSETAPAKHAVATDPGPISPWAGLWLLPAALQRLRVAEVESPFGTALGVAFMRVAAARLGIPPEDPALAPLPLAIPEPASPGTFAAPAGWRRLAAPHREADPAFALRRAGPGGRLLTDAAGRLPLAWTRDPAPLRHLAARARVRRRRPDAPAPPGPDLALRALWLALARLLRREAGTSPRGLIRREGLVAASATHVDVIFPGRLIAVPLRRAGLDLDPGWVPWLGRVLAYHYDLEGEVVR